MINPEDVANSVRGSVKGWCGAGGTSLGHIAHVILNSDDGDHVEIGSLFGASAIVAAKTLRQQRKSGQVFCVDPMVYEEHEANTRVEGTDTDRLMLRNQEMIFRDNIAKYDNIHLTKARSQPWPFDPDKHFQTAFIDGWHYEDGPLNDAKVLAGIVDECIILDDVVPAYTAVNKAFVYLFEHPDWDLWYKKERVAVFMRYNTPYIFTAGGTVHVVECEA